MAILTIAIPSLNGNSVIGKLLESISRCIDDDTIRDIKIMVFDNGSTIPLDETCLNPLISKGVNVSLKRFPNNLGYDRNIFRIVGFIESDYVWFLADDDTLLIDSFRMILDILTNSDRSILAIVLKALHDSADYQTEILDVSYFNDVPSYLQTVFLEVSLVSTLILKTSVIQLPSSKYVGLDWGHVALLLEICKRNKDGLFVFVKTHCVGVGVLPDRWSEHFGDGAVTALKHLVLMYGFRRLFPREFVLKFYLGRRFGRRFLLNSLLGFCTKKYRHGLVLFYYELILLKSKIVTRNLL